MKTFRYIYVAIFLFAVAIVMIVDLSIWERAAVIALTAAPFLINEFQEKKRSRVAAEQARHSSNSLQDQVLHAYKERS